MKKKKENKPKKNNLSFKRRLLVYYYRAIIVLKLFLICFILLFFFTDLFKQTKQAIKQSFYLISAKYGFILQNVIIEGQENMPINDILDAIKVEKGSPLFAVNIEEVQKILDSNFWIKTNLVERRLPNTIYITVIERLPIAIWQYNKQLYLIDSEGNRILAQDIGKFINLLHVVGIDANIYADSLIQSLNRYPDLSRYVISAVRYGGRRWDLNLQQDILIKMPEKDFDKAYDYLNSLNKSKKLFDQGYKMLDLRDVNRYYLKKK